MLHSKRFWILVAGLLIFGLVAGIVFWSAPTQTETLIAPDAGLSDTEIIQLAKDALAANYSGAPTQVAVRRSTVGALDKFHCSKIGAMISMLVSLLQGDPDICAADSTVWVVTLRGTFYRANFTTDAVQVVLDRTGRMMSVDSGALAPISW